MKKNHYELIEQIESWVEEGRYQDILDVLSALPPEEYDTELIGILARTYNSMGEYEKAIPLLLSIEQECKDDTNWFYRLGNSYYYTGRIQEAERLFVRASELDPNDADTKEFIYRCRPNFAKRVAAFWKWFGANEAQLSQMLEHPQQTDSQAMLDFIKKGTGLIHPDIHFNVGGNHEFTFSIEGRDYLFYLYPYLVSQMPDTYKDKWHFSPWNQGFESKDMGFAMYGKTFNFADILVKAIYNPERDEFKIRFYSPDLEEFHGPETYDVFYTMLDLCLGEGLAYLYISDVEMSELPEAGMFPFNELHEYIQITVIEANKTLKQTPHDIYDCYRKEPEESVCFRDDVIAGVTRYRPLVFSYYRGDHTRFNALLEYGAKAAFIAFPYNIKSERRTILNVRYELQDRLEQELLEPANGNPAIGMILEGASGDECMYIDLLLYDEKNFLKHVKEILKDYPYNFFYCDYRYGAWYTLLQDYDHQPRYKHFFDQCILREDI